MQDNQTRDSTAILRIGTDFFQIAIFAFLLAIGTSIISDELRGLLGSSLHNVMVGILLIIFAICFFWKEAYNKMFWSFEIEGALITNKSDNMPINVYRYPFLQSMNKYVKAICVENEAIKNSINNHPPFDLDKIIGDIKTKTEGITKSGVLLTECMEYYIIDLISKTLEEYFNDSDDDENISTLSRKDMPDILLTNRFVDQFSKPIEDRQVFLKGKTKGSTAEIHRFGPKEPNGTVVFATGENGEIYKIFEMTLPKGAAIAKNENNCLSIMTRFFSISIETQVTFFNKSLDEMFIRYYLNKNHDELASYVCYTKIHVKFHIRSVFYKNAWKYHGWIDLLLNRLSTNMDFGHFLDKIQWEANVTSIVADVNRERQEMRRRKPMAAQGDVSSQPTQ